ncbi:MAG: hypothetical protein SPI25_01765 [Dialister sp.]|nr:hypothetical protein [Dialister sp.]
MSRPITGVAPGTADTDAVNVAQFKVLESNGDMMNAGLSFHVSHRNQYAGCSKAALIEGQQKQSDTRKQENQELKEQVQNRQRQIEEILQRLSALKNNALIKYWRF